MTRKTTATKTKAAPAKTPRARKTTSTKTKLPASEVPAMETVAEVVALTPPAVVETIAVETVAVESVAVETVPAVEEVAARAPEITREAFELRVRRAAWRRANARGFRNGSPFEDWIQAEAEVRAQLDAEGLRLADPR